MQNVSIVKGTTNTFLISIEDANGNPYFLSNTEVLIFGVKTSEYAAEYILCKTITADDQVDEKYQFKLQPEDTEDMPFGTYLFDVGLQSGEEYYNIIKCSKFVLDANITKGMI